MNSARGTDTVKQDLQPHRATESDIGHHRCFIGLQRPRGGGHEAPVAPIERRTNQPPAQTTWMTELLRNTRHDGVPNTHLSTVGYGYCCGTVIR
ncbi:hypothetical protein MTY59_30580 [Mycobacterium senriense]|uniref:Uncharacterized protein n=1 Tax=Mycobacterium senriense TaxID=2775496 RepID=A0ABM7SS63_9MYCO|nr:hypothetical protein MTY59_30580 [Mycobacterium senriense]